MSDCDNHYTTPSSILILEDTLHMRTEILDALTIFPNAEVQCVSTIEDAKSIFLRLKFDMAIVDLGLPDGSGIDFIEWLSAIRPETIAIARTVFDDDDSLFGALSSGAQGYILKGEADENISEKLLMALQGHPVISPSIAKKVLTYFRQNRWEPKPDADINAKPLTERESVALASIAKGYTVAETAEAMCVSINTVKTHIKSAYSKLNIKSRAEAALAAKRLGILDYTTD